MEVGVLGTDVIGRNHIRLDSIMKKVYSTRVFDINPVVAQKVTAPVPAASAGYYYHQRV